MSEKTPFPPIDAVYIIIECINVCSECVSSFLEQESDTGSNSSTEDTSVQNVGVSSTSWDTGGRVVGTVGTVGTVRSVSSLDNSDGSERGDNVLELHFLCISD